ncbi:MAG TPA: hypothetical protein VMZ28_00100 [Kofleriaceae bacterium]|nr:hypothetical protein [Kofleriaceae bacterium]
MDHSETDTAFLAAAGELASGVTAELGGPLRHIRDALAVLVETLDRHFAEARGPEPYPWAATKALRERLAETYLVSREVTRTTGDLARAVALKSGAAESVDLNTIVEQAIALARHRFTGDSELSVESGELPAVRLAPGELMLVVASLLGQAADRARAAGPGTPVVVRTRRERADGEVDRAVIEVAAPGADEMARALAPLVARAVGGVGGALEAAVDAGGVPAAVIRIPVPR